MVTVRVAYLGPAGTFSQAAAACYVERYYRDPAAAPVELLPCPTIPDTLTALADSRAAEALLPLENALEGSVPLVLQALLDDPGIKVRGEVVLPIEQCLLGLPGATVDRLEGIITYPHALAQCRRFLASHLPGRKVEEASSTAAGARLVAERGDPRWAAIGPEVAAGIYGLVVLVRGIHDEKGNATRFIAVGGDDRPPSPGGRDKTSLILLPEHDRPGLLHDLLGEFARHQINLTRIESRPSRRRLGEYVFFVDCLGHRLVPPLCDVIEALGSGGETRVRVLGSYPVWDEPAGSGKMGPSPSK